MAVAGGPQAPGLRLWLGVACVARADGSWPVGQDASWSDADLGAGGGETSPDPEDGKENHECAENVVRATGGDGCRLEDRTQPDGTDRGL
jgi:hypothetical protein